VKTFKEIGEEIELVGLDHVELAGRFDFPPVEQMSPQEAADWMVSVIENVYGGDSYINESLNSLFCRTKMPYNPDGDIPAEWARELDQIVKDTEALNDLNNDGLLPY
jgi:hypothetical protein